METHDSQ